MRLDFQSLSDATTPGLCADGRCMDEIPLQDLATQVRARPGDRVVVLHQLGNHGPAYSSVIRPLCPLQANLRHP